MDDGDVIYGTLAFVMILRLGHCQPPINGLNRNMVAEQLIDYDF